MIRTLLSPILEQKNLQEFAEDVRNDASLLNVAVDLPALCCDTEKELLVKQVFSTLSDQQRCKGTMLQPIHDFPVLGQIFLARLRAHCEMFKALQDYVQGVRQLVNDRPATHPDMLTAAVALHSKLKAVYYHQQVYIIMNL